MTNEEARLALQDNFGYLSNEHPRIVEALRVAIEALSKPSLPSNLDEAANDGWAVYEYRESPKGLYSTCYIDGFKDGVEWVSGQGETIEGEVVKDINNNLVVKAKGLTMKDVKFGDEVIVQIRKK